MVSMKDGEKEKEWNQECIKGIGGLEKILMQSDEHIESFVELKFVWLKK